VGNPLEAETDQSTRIGTWKKAKVPHCVFFPTATAKTLSFGLNEQ
jgi:hypothetical protein